MSSPSRSNRGSGVESLIAEIDAYLAHETGRSPLGRRHSGSTMFVDHDENGDMRVSYRNSRQNPEQTAHPAPLGVAQGMHVRYDRNAATGGEASMYVEGFDQETQVKFDYDGSVMHLHKESSRASSQHSAYYRLDAEEYSPSASLFVEQDEDTHLMPGKERKKRSKAANFIQTILKKMDGLGLMNRFRMHRYRVRQQMKQQFKRKINRAS